MLETCHYCWNEVETLEDIFLHEVHLKMTDEVSDSLCSWVIKDANAMVLDYYFCAYKLDAYYIHDLMISEFCMHWQAAFPVRSVESPLSSSSLRNCSVKAALDHQPSVLRIDESLSPASLDSVVIAERDTKSEKYPSASPINSVECLEADQVSSFTNSCPYA